MARASLSAAYPPLVRKTSSARVYRPTLRSSGFSSIAMRSFSMRSTSASMPRPERMWATAVRPSSTPAMRGSWGRYPKPPRRTTRPAAGSASPPSTRNRLVFPAPLRPTNPTLSRGITVKSADATTIRPPTSTESPCACNISRPRRSSATPASCS